MHLACCIFHDLWAYDGAFFFFGIQYYALLHTPTYVCAYIEGYEAGKFAPWSWKNGFWILVQPIPEKMRPEMVIGFQNRILYA